MNCKLSDDRGLGQRQPLSVVCSAFLVIWAPGQVGWCGGAARRVCGDAVRLPRHGADGREPSRAERPPVRRRRWRRLRCLERGMAPTCDTPKPLKASTGLVEGIIGHRRSEGGGVRSADGRHVHGPWAASVLARTGQAGGRPPLLMQSVHRPGVAVLSPQSNLAPIVQRAPRCQPKSHAMTEPGVAETATKRQGVQAD